jgi:RNA polymerase sigma factor (sigma-70 family)
LPMGNAHRPPVELIYEAATPVLRALTRNDPYGRDELEDLLATVTAKVLGRLNQGPPVEDVARYAKQVARNTFNDWLRHRQRHPETPWPNRSDGEPVSFRAQQSSPSSVVARRDDQRRHAAAIRDGLDALSGTEREVLRLRYEEGRSAADVAKQLGYKNAAVVDTVAARARKKLADGLPPSLIDKVDPKRPRPAVRRRP